MIILSKNGRMIRAMVMNEPIDHCRGVVQCALEGCGAYAPVVVEVDGGSNSLKEQIEEFMEHHPCRATEFAS